jgi:hypothetical protein
MTREQRSLEKLKVSCPDLTPSLSSHQGDYVITGADGSGKILIHVQCTALSRAFRLYQKAYAVLETNHLLPSQNDPAAEGELRR